MALHPGQPGTIFIRGVQRAQLQKVNRLVQSMLSYNTKMAAKVPPLTFLSPADLLNFQVMAVSVQSLLDRKN
jgi:hypothetical protein